MEHKKLLLVSVSVGVFLVIIIGASVLLFLPRNPNPPVASGKGASRVEFAASGGNNAGAAPSGGNADSGNTADVGGVPAPAAPQENPFYINGEKAGAVTVEKLDNGSARTTVNVPRPAAPSVTVTAAKPAALPEPPPKAAPQTPAKTQAPAAKPAAPAASGTRSDYWVQAGSFTNKSRADSAKEYLEKKGIGSVITNGDVNGKTYYRVRVGPYTSQNEAAYWLSLIKTIDGMESALVWKSQPRL
jgi:DedD protein